VPAPGRLLVAVLAVAAVLAGCGAGEDAAAPSATTTGPVGEAAEFRALLVAVCSTATRPVPEVPDADAPTAVRRTYLAAVERAMTDLAPEVERLGGANADERDTLRELARRMRAVAAVARRTDAGSPAGAENDLAGSLARLNVAATRERLPQCGV
jgi:hypothetical protein